MSVFSCNNNHQKSEGIRVELNYLTIIFVTRSRTETSGGLDWTPCRWLVSGEAGEPGSPRPSRCRRQTWRQTGEHSEPIKSIVLTRHVNFRI